MEAAGSPAFDLAFAAGSETMAYSAARWAAERRHDLFRGADEVASTLFLWHLAEEVEHKSVAWDVYWQLHGDRPRARLRHAAATATALALMVVLVVTGTTLLLAAERRLHRPLAWFRLTRWSIGFAFELLGNLAVSLLPGHHPGRLRRSGVLRGLAGRAGPRHRHHPPVAPRPGSLTAAPSRRCDRSGPPRCELPRPAGTSRPGLADRAGPAGGVQPPGQPGRSRP